jgi:hypothetical protein
MRYAIIGLLVLAVTVLRADEEYYRAVTTPQPVAAPILELKPRAAVTWYGNQNFVTVIDSVVGNRGSFKFSTGADLVLLDKIAVFFDTDVYTNTNGSGFRPRFAEFFCGLKVKVTESISIKLEHSCGHPLRSYNEERGFNYFSGYDSITLSWSR